MSKPWEKYQNQSSSEGPWTKYQSTSSEKQKADNSRTGEAALEGFGEEASFGYLNNMQAAVEPLTFKVMNFLTGQDVESDSYLKARDSYKSRQEKLAAENPKSFAAGQVAGMITSSLPVAKAAQGATVAARALNAAKAGAVYGAIQNTKEKSGEINSIDSELAQRIENAGAGLAFGAASSVGADAISKGIGKISKIPNTIGEKLKGTAEKLAENAPGATRVQAEKFPKGAGRYLLDNEVVGLGDDAESIAKKAQILIKKSEDAIDESLKSLDSSGLKVSQDKIVEKIQGKINELSKDASQSDVARKLETIVSDIVQTGDSSINPSSAEKIKRGFNRMAKNWQDPEKGQAGKIAYQAYKEAVEETAGKAGTEVLEKFKKAKSDFGKLNPIADAAEKRARQLNQHPIGGLLDIATVGASAAGSDDVGDGLVRGLGAVAARRFIAPKIASTAAVSLDKISKILLQNPEFKQVAQKSPELFTAVLDSTAKRLRDMNLELKFPVAASNPTKGPDKWANDGLKKLQEHDSSAFQDPAVIEQLKKSKKGRDLLIKASDLDPGTNAMDKILKQIKSANLNGAE